uniref:Uncharacterized protein n=1 Tax=Setaria italica TaxID=4555 RepID=K4AHX8_SETIT
MTLAVRCCNKKGETVKRRVQEYDRITNCKLARPVHQSGHKFCSFRCIYSLCSNT